ncbi:Uncharacterised protein [Legionella israelensis]|uniref:Uncharacterized protein n=2 Tax=Legionella israelensis TaxID=454 RepID=A0A0W0WS68_9GAMM|nr:hypothetical protein [Legionella israelensis]KTD35157.1 hypothetical protein Lisr_0049 [Legionella israelensis]QBS08691.1 hypothetical protein E4T55_01745 [Legionella israelensis]SCY00816.1 hypothetical protein SAMN02746069_00969 [Legionella israelensis DSM 19235]STX58358.1 Uncharacterised protein [Legionella israelensis]
MKEKSEIFTNKHKKQSPASSMAKFFKTKGLNKTHVIIFYAYSDEYPHQVKHELSAGVEAGVILSKIFHQQEIFIYAPDKEKACLVAQEYKKHPCEKPLINLCDNENNIVYFLSKIQEGDSLLINGQGDPEAELIAGRDAESLIEILLEDLELSDKGLKNLDVDSCRMGLSFNYRQKLIAGLSTAFNCIITYTMLCSWGMSETNQPYRQWIKLNDNNRAEDADDFYSTDDLETYGIRIKESTASINPLLAEQQG